MVRVELSFGSSFLRVVRRHYVIKGTEGTPYEGGYYHGKLKFPSEYPLRPPSVLMLTPSGRFKTNRRLCLSMSDFHPESWNPMWSVSTILTGLYSFMLENSPTLGSMDASVSQRKRLATQSLAFNCSDPQFRELFSDLVDLHRTVVLFCFAFLDIRRRKPKRVTRKTHLVQAEDKRRRRRLIPPATLRMLLHREEGVKTKTLFIIAETNLGHSCSRPASAAPSPSLPWPSSTPTRERKSCRNQNHI